MPAILTSIRCGTSSPVASPTCRCAWFATWRSTTTSGYPRRVGREACPATMWNGLRAGTAIQLPASCGPCTGMTLPVRSRSCPVPWITGSAAATPGTAATRGSRAPSIPLRGAPELLLTAEALRTLTSVPLKACTNRWSMLAASVSLTIRVPARKATPRKTAMKAPTSRRLWVQRLLAASLVVCISDLQRLQVGKDRRHARRCVTIDDAPVSQEQDGIGVCRGDRVVGHHDDRLPQVRHRLAHTAEDLGAGP